jgi:hypothetical protein
MALIIEAPNEVYSVQNNRNIKLFLAGGITNCEWWQTELIELIKGADILTVYNPRRKNFPIHDPHAAEEQITWEHNHMVNSDMISFWFSKGSLNPIVLLELGKYCLATKKKVFVGIDPGYERTQDVVIQTKLSRPDVRIVYSLVDLASQILQSVD